MDKRMERRVTSYYRYCKRLDKLYQSGKLDSLDMFYMVHRPEYWQYVVFGDWKEEYSDTGHDWRELLPIIRRASRGLEVKEPAWAKI